MIITVDDNEPVNREIAYIKFGSDHTARVCSEDLTVLRVFPYTYIELKAQDGYKIQAQGPDMFYEVPA